MRFYDFENWYSRGSTFLYGHWMIDVLQVWSEKAPKKGYQRLMSMFQKTSICHPPYWLERQRHRGGGWRWMERVGGGVGKGWWRIERVEACQPKYYSNCNEWLRTTSGCEQRVVANNEWLLIATSGCEQRVVANNESLLIATSGCEQRVVANDESLLNATSGCEQRVVARTARGKLFGNW